MNCLDCRDLLQEQLDGRPVAGGELEQHLKGCSDCRQLFAAARCLDDALRQLPAPLAPPGFSDRLVESLLNDRRRRLIWRRRAIAVTALAASLVFAVLIGVRGWLASGPTEVAQAPPAMEEPAPTPTPESPVPAPPSLQDSVAELGLAVAALARRTTEETMEPARLLWPDAATQSRPVQSDASAESLWEAGQGVTAGLEPVTTSARRAMDLFLRELPPVMGSSAIPN